MYSIKYHSYIQEKQTVPWFLNQMNSSNDINSKSSSSGKGNQNPAMNDYENSRIYHSKACRLNVDSIYCTESARTEYSGAKTVRSRSGSQRRGPSTRNVVFHV